MAEFLLTRDPISGIYNQVTLVGVDPEDDVYKNNNVQNEQPVLQCTKLEEPVVHRGQHRRAKA